MNEATQVCEDIDECSKLYSPCGWSEKCVNTPGSYVCVEVTTTTTTKATTTTTPKPVTPKKQETLPPTTTTTTEGNIVVTYPVTTDVPELTTMEEEVCDAYTDKTAVEQAPIIVVTTEEPTTTQKPITEKEEVCEADLK